MIRFLYVTDTHLRGTAPVSRTDDFASSVLSKIRKTVSIANNYNVDAVLHGGDLFDIPEPGLGQVGLFLEVLKDIHAPILITPGNHDMYGHNPNTLERTLLGLLKRIGFLDYLTPEPHYFVGDGIKVQITGQGFHAEIDRRDIALDYAVRKPPGCDYAIHVVHGMALPQRVISSAPFLPAATAAEEILRITEADYTLTGHYHLPFEISFEISNEEKRVVNPGALVRLSAIQEEIDRMPAVMLIECSQSGISHRIIPLACAKPGSEVLDRSHLDVERLRNERRQAFLASLDEFRGDRFAALEPEEVLREVLSHLQASPEVQGEVWMRFQEITSSQ